VPHTVKLSQRFYEKFGHDLVNELVNWFNETDTTYRAELRELNDLNFARFDAKLEQRLAEVKGELGKELAEVKADLRSDIAKSRADLLGALHAEGQTLIRWMFGFWVATVTTLGGLVVAVLHFLPAARP